jgi:hypothetical protein
VRESAGFVNTSPSAGARPPGRKTQRGGIPHARADRRCDHLWTGPRAGRREDVGIGGNRPACSSNQPSTQPGTVHENGVYRGMVPSSPAGTSSLVSRRGASQALSGQLAAPVLTMAKVATEPPAGSMMREPRSPRSPHHGAAAAPECRRDAPLRVRRRHHSVGQCTTDRVAPGPRPVCRQVIVSHASTSPPRCSTMPPPSPSP